MKPPFSWDEHSDQPYQLDSVFKKEYRRGKHLSLAKTALSGLLFLPAALLALPFLRPRPVEETRFVGMVVDPRREPAKTLDALRELGIREIAVRIPMWDETAAEAAETFVKNAGGFDVLFVLMQDREHVENGRLRSETFLKLFKRLSPFGRRFQIGTTVNRAKWGFFGIDEYLEFFRTARQLRDEIFPDLKLIGPSVIDFEYHFTAHALFNFKGVKFDAVNALLYVDRRGAPENLQAGCDLPCKINLLSSLVTLSPRARHPLYITETNWPLAGTAPYAPTSEKECVDEETYASYMVRYFLLALATRQVKTVYWHQLVAPGYGLVDHRDGFTKRPAFAALRTLQRMLENSRFVVLSQKKGLYEMVLEKPDGILRIFWANGRKIPRQFSRVMTLTDRDGNTFEAALLKAGDAPVYLYEKEPA